MVWSQGDAYTTAISMYGKRPQPVANDLAAGEDKLNLGTEVGALAEMLLLREVEPPLVLGLLGGWGSGKSFAMHLFQRKVEEIRALPMEEPGWSENSTFPFVGHPYFIHFDAWTYAKGNLWASLMQTILRELNEQLSVDAAVSNPLAGGETWKQLSALRAKVLTAGVSSEMLKQTVDQASPKDSPDLLWNQLMTRRQKERDRLEEAERKLAEDKKALEDAKAALIQAVEEKIDRRARQAALTNTLGSLAAQLGIAPEELKLEDDASGKDLADTKTWASRGKLAGAWRFAKRDAAAMVCLGAFFLVPIIVGVLLGRFGSAIPWLSGITGIAGLIATAGAKWHQWMKTFDDARATYLQKVEVELERQRAAREALLQAELQKQRASPGGIRSQEGSVAKGEAEVLRLRQSVGITGKFTSIAEIVAGRVDRDEYGGELGLMHRIQKDLAEITDGLVLNRFDDEEAIAAKKKLFPRGPPRVVLFIDDLDRCPPQRVVDVLEAIQLLVKTRLFVVVVAMDERYVTRALEKAYEGVLTRKGDPSGYDYIEKIVQIPYRMRPLGVEAAETYLRSMLRVAPLNLRVTLHQRPPHVVGPITEILKTKILDRISLKLGGGQTMSADEENQEQTPLSTAVIKATAAELHLLAKCVAEARLSARSAKRLANVFKVLKIIWHRRDSEPPEAGKGVLLALLGLSSRFPEAMRHVLRELSGRSEDWMALLRTMFDPAIGPKDPFARAQWPEFCRVMQAMMPPEWHVPPMDVQQLHLLESFSFIGDLGLDSSDIL